MSTTLCLSRPNRRRVMTFAWTWARQRAWSTRTFKPRAFMGEALRAAWANERNLLSHEARQAAVTLRPATVLRAEIEMTEAREMLGFAGIERLAALRSELSRALAA